jgi:transcriptional regulator with XRE-family HTH domain
MTDIEQPKEAKKYPNDTSGNLFDYIKRKFDLTTDEALAQKTGLWKNDISRIRNGKRKGLTNSNKLKIHVSTKLSIAKIERLIAKEEE